MNIERLRDKIKEVRALRFVDDLPCSKCFGYLRDPKFPNCCRWNRIAVRAGIRDEIVHDCVKEWTDEEIEKVCQYAVLRSLKIRRREDAEV